MPGTACARMSPYTSCDQSLTYVVMSVQNAESESHVISGLGHTLARRHAGLVPRAARALHPAGPGGEVDLRHRVEVPPQRPDPPGLVAAEGRLVSHERRDGDVVLRAGRRGRGELR